MIEVEIQNSKPETTARANQRADARRSDQLDAGSVGRVSGVGVVARGLSAEARQKPAREQGRSLSEREEQSYVNRDAVNMLTIIECFRGINTEPLTFARIMQRSGLNRDQVRRLVISGKAKSWIKEIMAGKERQFIPGPKAVNWARELIASELRRG